MSEYLLTAKQKIGMFVIGVVAILQGIAWVTGKNGMMFALTTSTITGIGGLLLGISFKPKKV